MGLLLIAVTAYVATQSLKTAKAARDVRRQPARGMAAMPHDLSRSGPMPGFAPGGPRATSVFGAAFSHGPFAPAPRPQPQAAAPVLQGDGAAFVLSSRKLVQTLSDHPVAGGESCIAEMSRLIGQLEPLVGRTDEAARQERAQLEKRVETAWSRTQGQVLSRSV